MSSPDIHRAVAKAKAQLCRWTPYLSGAVVEIPWRLDQSLGDRVAAGTDGTSVLIGDRFSSLSPAMAAYVYLHQLVHVLYGHLDIRVGSTETDWNIAIDLAAERIVAAMVRQTPLAAADPNHGGLADVLQRVAFINIEVIHIRLRTDRSIREDIAACPKDSPCPLGEGHRMPEPGDSQSIEDDPRTEGTRDVESDDENASRNSCGDCESRGGGNEVEDGTRKDCENGCDKDGDKDCDKDCENGCDKDCGNGCDKCRRRGRCGAPDRGKGDSNDGTPRQPKRRTEDGDGSKGRERRRWRRRRSDSTSRRERLRELRSRVMREIRRAFPSRDAGLGAGDAEEWIVPHDIGHVCIAELTRLLETTAQADEGALRYNRRYIHMGLYLPREHQESIGPVLVAIDTSGSMSTLQLGCVERFLEQLRAQRVHGTVIDFDTTVTSERPLAEIDPAAFGTTQRGAFRRGRGGTDLRIPFARLDEGAEMFRLLIVITDGCGPMPASPPDVPVIWIDVLPERAVDSDTAPAPRFQPPFGAIHAFAPTRIAREEKNS